MLLQYCYQRTVVSVRKHYKKNHLIVLVYYKADLMLI